MYSKYLNSDGGVSDLACERGRADTSLPGVMRSVELCGKFNWERIRICSSEGAESIGRPIGNYDTLTLPRMDELDEEDVEDAANEVAKELCTVLDRLDVCPARLLVVGLGNRELTPDSVGPKVAARINATMASFMYPVLPLKVRLPSGDNAIVPFSFFTRIQVSTARASVACFLMGIGANAQRNNLDTQPLENKSSLAM